MSFGDNFFAHRRLRIEVFQVEGYENSHKIVIGNNVSINPNCHIGAINRIEIHDNVLIGGSVLITDHQHGCISEDELIIPPKDRKLWSKGPVIIERNVWIGEGVSVMPGVRIGENSIIGTNSVVTKNIPSNCVAAGNPCKVIKFLS